MPDLTSISTVLSSIKTASDLAKLIKGSEISLKDAEIKLKLADLIGALADAKIELSEIHTLLQTKEQEITDLRTQLDLNQKVTWEKPYYWFGPKEDVNGPYCQNCYDDKSKLIRLQGNGEGWWECKSCESTFKDSSYKPHTPRVRSRRRFWDDY